MREPDRRAFLPATPVSRRSIALVILKRTIAAFWADRIPSVAAGVTFFFLLAIFPAIFSLVSLYGLFADRSSIAQLVGAVAPYLPSGATEVLHTDLARLIAEKPAKLNFGFFSGMAIAFWSASGGVSALIDALNVAFDQKETRGFFRLTADALIVTILSIIALTAGAYLAVAVPVALARLSYGLQVESVLAMFSWPATFLIAALLLRLVYRLGPDRHRDRTPWITWGSGIAATLWILGTLLFSWYVQNFGSFDRVYGNLGSAVGFLTWIWLSVVTLLAGAEIDHELDTLTRG
jgi:membrane protein